MVWCLTYIILVGFGTSGLQNMVQQIWGYPSPKNPSTSRFWYLHALAIDVLDVVTLLIFLLMSLLYYFWTSLINIYISDLDVILAGKLGVGDIYYTWQNEPRNETKSKMIKVRLVYYAKKSFQHNILRFGTFCRYGESQGAATQMLRKCLLPWKTLGQAQQPSGRRLEKWVKILATIEVRLG